MDYFPVFLDIRARPCVVVGGGDSAAQKVKLLLAAGAQVRVVATQLCEPLNGLLAMQKINHVDGEFERAHLRDAALVFAATDDPEIAERVFRCASDAHIPVNVVDQPEMCTFIMPAIVDRGAVVCAISTGGASPSLAGALRAKLEALFPARLGDLANFLDDKRQEVKAHFGSSGERREFWQRVLNSKLVDHILAGEALAAQQIFQQMLQSASPESKATRICIVQLKSQDADDVSLGVYRKLLEADVVIYDAKVAPQILALARRDAQQITLRPEGRDLGAQLKAFNQLFASHLREARCVYLSTGNTQDLTELARRLKHEHAVSVETM